MSIKAGIETTYSIAQSLGLIGNTGLALGGELSGLIPNKRWKQDVYHRDWTHGDTVNASIGQGYVSMTPMQLLVLFARVASGKMVMPSIHIGENDKVAFGDIDVEERHLDLLRNSLTRCCNDPIGTGYSVRIHEKQFMMAGKTGTAQVVSKDTSNKSLFKKDLHSHAIFAGYAPAHNPKYATVVIAENAGWGVVTAGPIGRDVLYFAQKLYSDQK